MSQINLMIQPYDVIASSNLDGNIDVDNLKPFIGIAQTTHLKAFLGTKLYTKIYNDYSLDYSGGVFTPNNLTGEYLIIYEDYIKDFLSYYTSALFVDFGGYKITENGLHKVAGENTTSLSETETETLSLKYTKLVSNVESNFKEYVSDKNIPELVNETINIQTDFPWQ
jgi:hypothetical protein